MMDLKAFSGKRICVAVSGGVDSTALLAYLYENADNFGYTLSVCHCEHGIRGEESLQDAEFVKALCMQYDLPMYSFAEDCIKKSKAEKTSLETAARDFRHACFKSIIEENKADYIATAHHKNDEAETVLFRLARGTSATGVGGMSATNGYFIRPFLAWTRQEIEAYAREKGLSYREDKTNLETEATRNKLRLEILPKLEEAVPGAMENLVRFSTLTSEDDKLLYEYAEGLLSKEEEGFEVAFCDKKPLFTRAALLALKGLGLSKDYTAQHLESAFLLQGLERGAKLSLPKNIIAEKRLEGIFFSFVKEGKNEQKPEVKPFDLSGFDGGRYEVILSETPKGMGMDGWKGLCLDVEAIPQTAVFRFRKEGDYILRFGGGKKSLKKFFNEEKTPVSERGYLPLIAERDGGEVYAVCGVEISEKVKVTKKTKKVLYITLKKK